MQTRGHQSIAERILAIADVESHGIKVVKVYYREGLHDMQGALSGLYRQYLENIHYYAVKGKEYNHTHMVKEIELTIKYMKDMGLTPSIPTIEQLEERLEEMHVKYLDSNLLRWSDLNADRTETELFLKKYQGSTVKRWSDEIKVLGKGSNPGYFKGETYRMGYNNQVITRQEDYRVDMNLETVKTDAEFFKGLAELD